MHVPIQNVRNEIKTKTRQIRNGDGWMDGWKDFKAFKQILCRVNRKCAHVFAFSSCRVMPFLLPPSTKETLYYTSYV